MYIGYYERKENEPIDDIQKRADKEKKLNYKAKNRN